MRVLRFGPEAHDASEKPSEKKVVFLHGFPGIRSRQNRDLAEAVAKKNKTPVEVLLYQGLGQVEGQFSFQKCLEDVRSYFTEVKSSCDLVGHSWGGFLSLLMANEFPAQIRKVVLLSPLLSFIGQELASPWFKEKALEHPQIDFADPKVMAHEFSEIGRRFPARELIQNLPKEIQVLFLQAKNDPITPAAIASERKADFPCSLEFALVDTDHSFLLNRSETERKIVQFLQY